MACHLSPPTRTLSVLPRPMLRRKLATSQTLNYQGLRPAFATTRLPMRPAFTHRIQTIQPALLSAQMNDMPLDLSQSDLQARRGRTRTL